MQKVAEELDLTAAKEWISQHLLDEDMMSSDTFVKVEKGEDEEIMNVDNTKEKQCLIV